MTSTRSVLWAALAAIALTSGVRAAVAPPVAGSAWQATATDDWCADSGGERWGRDRERASHCEVRDYTVPATGTTLSVNAEPNGGISVEGAARQDIQIRARVNTTARTPEEAKAIASRIQIVATADRVEADGPGNLRDNESWSVSYRLQAPRQTPLNLRTTNGGISISDISSRLEFRTVNGGVKLGRVGGEVEGRTSNGGITVELDGSTWDGQGLDVETTNGGVTLSVPASYSAHLEASTNNGGLNVDFPVTVQGRLGRTISTDLGSGGPTLRLKTSNGGIRVRAR